MKGSVCCLLTLLVEAEDLSSMGHVLGYVGSTLTELYLLQMLSAIVMCVYEANRANLCGLMTYDEEVPALTLLHNTS